MKSIIFLSILLLLIGCSKSIHRNNEITRIEFARSGAWSDFGASISINDSLNYKYWGDYKGAKQKYFTGKISEAFWDTLNIKLEEARFKTIIPTGYSSCKDCKDYELIVYWNNKKRRIFRTDHQQRDSIIRVFKWLDSSYNSLKLTQVEDSLKFETTAHILLKPNIKSIKFPPPGNLNN